MYTIHYIANTISSSTLVSVHFTVSSMLIVSAKAHLPVSYVNTFSERT